jgi:hypothetical protein
MKNESAYSRAIFQTAQASFPEAFAIITAYNPDGIDHAVEENEALNRLLQREITKRHHSNCCSLSSCGLKCTTFLRFKVHHPEEVFLSILLARFVERDL